MTTRRKHVLASGAHAVLCAIGGALLFYLLQPSPEPRVEFSVLHVSAREFAKHEPDTKVSLPERIVRPPRKLEQRVVADSAGRELRDRFVAAATDTPRTEVDSAGGPEIQPEKRERLAYPYAWRYTRSRLELFTFTSDGAKERLTYRVCPNVTGSMVGDSALVQGPRLCWVPDVLGLGGAGALGYGLASRDPLIAGAGVVLLIVRHVMK